MSRHMVTKSILGGVTFSLCLVSSLVLSAPDDQTTPPTNDTAASEAPATEDAATPAPANNDPSPAVEQAYVGSNQCFICHRPQTNTWTQSKHAQAFTDVPENYQNDPACLKCHVTGFGEPDGYVAGTEKDLLQVGCESCHGPGALHIDAGQRFVMAAPGEEEKLIQEIKDTVTKTPSVSVCVACHISQAHQSHPAYEGQPSELVAPGRVLQCNPAYAVAQRQMLTATIAHGGSPYSIKTCGSCHYKQYKQWGSSKHASLAAQLPAKYSQDENCRNCHRSPQTTWTSSDATADPHHNMVGAACESCHGPGLEHIGFTRQYISPLPLSPIVEQAARNLIHEGQPDNACLQCHLAVTHKEHPQFEAK